MATVAFCPTTDSTSPLKDTVTLKQNPFVLSAPTGDIRWIAHVCSQLAHTREPLVLVFLGETSVHAPAIGFSRKSLHRPAVAYILVDPVMPQVGGEYGDWPDAPVTVVITDAAGPNAKEASMQSRLRGWTVTNEPLQNVLADY